MNGLKRDGRGETKKKSHLIHIFFKKGLILLLFSVIIRVCMKYRREEVESMPNIKSSKKDVLSSKIAYEKNKADKSELKTNLKKFQAAVEGGDKTAAQSAYMVAV